MTLPETIQNAAAEWIRDLWPLEASVPGQVRDPRTADNYRQAIRALLANRAQLDDRWDSHEIMLKQTRTALAWPLSLLFTHSRDDVRCVERWALWLRSLHQLVDCLGSPG